MSDSDPLNVGCQALRMASIRSRALGQRRVRSALAAGGDGAGPREARRALHAHERSRNRGCGGHPIGLASQRVCGKPQFTGPGGERLGFASLESGVLVPGDITLAVVPCCPHLFFSEVVRVDSL
jgi:hypothetical protein